MPIPTATFPSQNDTGPENDNTFAGVSNNEICDRTGFKVPIGTLVREWDGKMVRRQSFETRHPQELARARPESPKGSPRPEPEDQFIADDEQIQVSDL